MERLLLWDAEDYGEAVEPLRCWETSDGPHAFRMRRCVPRADRGSSNARVMRTREGYAN
jgi:hypothetical protein